MQGRTEWLRLFFAPLLWWDQIFFMFSVYESFCIHTFPRPSTTGGFCPSCHELDLEYPRKLGIDEGRPYKELHTWHKDGCLWMSQNEWLLNFFWKNGRLVRKTVFRGPWFWNYISHQWKERVIFSFTKDVPNTSPSSPSVPKPPKKKGIPGKGSDTEMNYEVSWVSSTSLGKPSCLFLTSTVLQAISTTKHL